jgi:hypothetical protein
MTASMRQLLQFRDEFRARFPVEGMISLGFSKSADGLCLSVVVDRDSPEPALPDRFRDFAVRIERGSRPVWALGSVAPSSPDY